MSTPPHTMIGPQLDPSFAQRLAARQPTRFRHGLPGHPLLSLDAIARLGEELPAASVSVEVGEKPIAAGAAESVAVQVDDIGEAIRNIAITSSWFTLLHIHQVDRYRLLVDEIIEGLAATTGLAPGSLRRRMGFLFASSPRAVTAAHFDIEQSFCMQLQGTRTLGFGAWVDDDERARDVRDYWNGDFGRFHTMPVTTDEFEIGPGDGCYIPPWTPHWITNHDDTSLSMTVTFFNDDNENESLVQAFNTKFENLGLHPRRYGVSPGRDQAKVRFMRSYAATKRRLGIAESGGSH